MLSNFPPLMPPHRGWTHRLRSAPSLPSPVFSRPSPFNSPSHQRAEDCLLVRPLSILSSFLPSNFTRLFIICWGAEAGGGEGRLGPGDGWPRPVSARRGLTSKRRGLTSKRRSEWRRGAEIPGHALVDTMTSSVCTRRTSLVQGRGLASLE